MKKLTYLESLPAGYRFTGEDEDRYWLIIMAKVFCAYEDMQDLTPDESDFCDVIDLAHRIKGELKFWPTKETVIERIEKQREEEIEKRNKLKCKQNALPDKS